MDVQAHPLTLAMLAGLDDAGVRWVYWKPRSGLAAALRGAPKDVDLLVAPDDMGKARETISAFGGYPFAQGPEALPHSESWVAWEEEHASFVHLHLHSELVGGRHGVHEFKLPFAEELLDARVKEDGVWVLPPALDGALLMIRSVVDEKFGGDLTGKWRLHDDQVEAIAAELSKLDKHELREAAHALGFEHAAESAIEKGFPRHGGAVLWFREVVTKKLVRRKGTASEAKERFSRLARGVVKSRIPKSIARPDAPPGLRRTDGFMVSLVGVDGSGKSTLCASLTDWLSSVFAVRTLYLGRGDWVSDATQVLAEVKWGVLERVTSTKRPEPEAIGASDKQHVKMATPKQSASPSRAPASRAQLAKRLLADGTAVALAGRKKRDLATADAWRDQGLVLVSDRFPHSSEPLLDGPVLKGTTGDPLRFAMGQLEARSFDQITQARPDLLLRLCVDAEVAAARKPDHDAETIRHKVEAFEAAKYEGFDVVDLDANASADEVLLQAKRAIWERL